jgi:hypothetical protein
LGNSRAIGREIARATLDIRRGDRAIGRRSVPTSSPNIPSISSIVT